MRFAWQKRQSANTETTQPDGSVHLFRLAYNAAWLLPIVLTYTGRLDYATGFAAFAAICLVRFIANWYANNVLNAAEFDAFLFRA